MYYTIKDLKRLINAMSGAEKRYFVVASKAFLTEGQYPNYLKLFDLLKNSRSQTPEPEIKLSDRVQTSAKRQLFENIIKSLRDFHKDRSIDTVIQNLLGEIELLYHLNLPQQSLVPFGKAYRLASDHEKFGLLLQVLEWERRLNIVLPVATRPTMEIQYEEQIVLEKLQQVLDIESIYNRAKELKKYNGYVKGPLKKGLERETVGSLSLPELIDCKSRKAIYYYHFIHALYYWMIFDHQNAYQHSKELLTTDIQLALPSDYIDGILEHVTSCVCIGHFDAALNGLSIAEVYCTEHKLDLSHAFRLKLFYYRACYHIIIYNFTGKKVKLQAAIKEAEAGMVEFGDQLPPEYRLVILGNLMNAYLGLGNLKKVGQTWDLLFHKQHQSTRSDIYDDLYLFRLFLVLQNKTYEVLSSVASSAYRYYKNRKAHFTLEMDIASLFMKKQDFSKQELLREVLEEISGQLQVYLGKLKVTYGFQEHYTFYLIWIKGLLSERPFHQQAAIWYKDFQTKQ